MELDKTVNDLSKRYNVKDTEVYQLMDMIKGRLFIKHPIRYIMNHNDTLMTVGVMTKKYLGIRHAREKKYYDKIHNVVI